MSVIYYRTIDVKQLTHLSLAIMRMPCTKRPFKICGPIPLKSPPSPSCSIMKFITSIKLLNGFPFLAGGGLDCNPTLATMSGWVTIVARDFDMAPRTVGNILDQRPICLEGRDFKLVLTESFPRSQIGLAREKARLQALVGAVGNRRVNNKYQACFQAPP